MIENEVEEPDTSIESAMDRARARGRVLAQQFYELPPEQKIQWLAEMIYVTVVLDPMGYPNGQPNFGELPDIDYNHEIGNDKVRYIQAASAVYSRLMWKPNNQ